MGVGILWEGASSPEPCWEAEGRRKGCRVWARLQPCQVSVLRIVPFCP